MTSTIIANLEKMLGGPRDGSLLRYLIGSERLKAGDPARAVTCFREAIERDANFSAAWKQLGKALTENADIPAALDAYAQGIQIAGVNGDLQAAKEMTVFAKRLRKQQGENAS